MNDTKIKGLVTELQCQTYLTNLGYNVSVPLGEDCRYDFIVDVDGILIRVQVKHCHMTSTGITIPCRSTQVNTKASKAKTYSKEQIDFFATYYDNKCYLIKVEECSTQKTLSFSNQRTNQQEVCYIDDYEAEKQINNIVNGIEKIPEERKIYQYDLRNHLIDTYNSCREAARIGLGDVHKNGKISQCIRGIRQTAYGYKWTDTLIKG